MPILEARNSLAIAFNELVHFVDTLLKEKIPLEAAQNKPTFAYILTPKQMDSVKRLCKREKWPVPSNRGIEIDIQYIKHVLSSRLQKDLASTQFVAELLAAAFCDQSKVTINKKHGRQALILNATKRISLHGDSFYGIAILEIRDDDATEFAQMVAVTAYHANEAKLRKIQRR